jgi:hypothetical protein
MPRYKWGSINHHSVGTVTSISPNEKDVTGRAGRRDCATPNLFSQTDTSLLHDVVVQGN